MGEYFQSSLTEAGFNNIKIETLDWSAWLTESQTDGRFDISLYGWSNVTRDGTELMEPNSIPSMVRPCAPDEDDGPWWTAISTPARPLGYRCAHGEPPGLQRGLRMRPMSSPSTIHHLFCYNEYTNITWMPAAPSMCDFDYAAELPLLRGPGEMLHLRP